MASVQDAPPAASGISETSPLLVDPDLLHDTDANGNVENGQPAEANGGNAPQEGNPEMLKKMHLFIPAVGIGVSFRPICACRSGA